MFRLIGAAAVNAGLLSYAGFFRAKNVDQVYANLDEKSREAMYNNCPVQKYGSSYDAFSAINERMLTLDPDSHKNDQPLKPFK